MYKNDYNIPDFMNSADFWMNDISDSKEIMLSVDEINEFNNKLKPIVNSLYSIDKETATIASKILIGYIQSYELPLSDMYDSNGELLHQDYYEKIIHNTNLDAIKDYTTIKYGISVRKTSVRSFPVENSIFSSIEQSKTNNFDRFQETGLFPCEPVLILHESSDKKWYFVKLYNYFGWVKTDDIAIAENKEQIFDYTNCKDFLLVTVKEATLIINENDSSPITITCGMGTKLSLMENHMVKFPTRSSNGKLVFKSAVISNNEDIIKGYLPYTRYNIINQALRFIDTPYDWGDKFSGKDCSSFILTIYKCFGFLLPRNANQQESSFLSSVNSLVFTKEDTLENRNVKMDKLNPGDALFMKGHVMMYLGKYKFIHYMIHSFAGYGVKKEAVYESRKAMLVAITPVDLPKADGVPFILKFTSSVHYQ
ncbi:MAG TPA: SH3 domain-containing protein [Clostridiaceae bacterium]